MLKIRNLQAGYGKLKVLKQVSNPLLREFFTRRRRPVILPEKSHHHRAH